VPLSRPLNCTQRVLLLRPVLPAAAKTVVLALTMDWNIAIAVFSAERTGGVFETNCKGYAGQQQTKLVPLMIRRERLVGPWVFAVSAGSYS